MTRSIAVCGAGPGLGQAVARRYARDGYDVVLVARRRDPLESLAEELAGEGATVHVVDADLSEESAVPAMAERIRARVGDLDVLYYAPTPDGDFVPAADLTARRAAEYLPLTFYTLLELVGQFLPGMLERGDGAILTAQGASSVRGLPNLSGPGPAQAAQRNYLQSLHAEVADNGVYVGMLYVGAAIEHSAFHVCLERARAAGEPVWEMPVADPAHLADLLWTMHSGRQDMEVTCP